MLLLKMIRDFFMKATSIKKYDLVKIKNSFLTKEAGFGIVLSNKKKI